MPQPFYANLDKALTNGIVFPTDENGDAGVFNPSFKISNGTNEAKRYYYKIFYQNESYAHKLMMDVDTPIYNPAANNNFYGSWMGEDSGFHTTKEIQIGEEVLIQDEIAIMGNPRNEKKYFGGPLTSP